VKFNTNFLRKACIC